MQTDEVNEKTVPDPDISPYNDKLMSSEDELDKDDGSLPGEMDDNSDEDPTLFGPSIDKVEMDYAKIGDDSTASKPRLIMNNFILLLKCESWDIILSISVLVIDIILFSFQY
jgi:hypothetical protein